MTNSQYNRIFAIITSALVILLGICFIVCCTHLYFTGGDTPYSYISISKYLPIVAVPSALTIMVIIGGFVIKTTCGIKDDETTERTYSERLESYKKKFDVESIDSKVVQEKMLTEKKNKTIAKHATFTFSAVVFAIIFAYLIFVAKFSIANLNADVISAFTFVLPLAVIAVGIHIPRVLLDEESAKRELDLFKKYTKTVGPIKTKPKAKKAKSEVDYFLIVKALLITVSVVFVLLGILNGGMSDVLQKGVKICTECIGLG